MFRKIDMWGSLGLEALRPNAVQVMLRQRTEKAQLQAGPLEAISAHGLRAGFIHSAYVAGVPDEVIMAHSRHKDHATMRGYLRRAHLRCRLDTMARAVDHPREMAGDQLQREG